ncbi:MAG TPA: NAD(+) synthase [Desulfomicrobiaceae bacterium]|nr:NAD(+) synthase [Desulfomicrobiaceae bacterium]
MSKYSTMICPEDSDYQAWLDLLQIRPSRNLLQEIGDFLVKYQRDHNLGCYVVGLSGGIDSTFLAALLYSRDIPYLGFSLPIQGNAPDEVARGEAVAGSYCMAHLVPGGDGIAKSQNLTDLYRSVSERLGQACPASSPLAEGNIKARVRMIFLYHMAQLHRGCVLSTDQLDELLTGFWTLHGDVGDVSPLQLIPKSVEYELAELLCADLDDPAPLQAAIAAVPTDGLGISASDLDQLGVDSYQTVEKLFKEYFQLRLQEQSSPLTGPREARLQELEATGPVSRFLGSGFKRSGPILFDPFV